MPFCKVSVMMMLLQSCLHFCRNFRNFSRAHATSHSLWKRRAARWWIYDIRCSRFFWSSSRMATAAAISKGLSAKRWITFFIAKMAAILETMIRSWRSANFCRRLETIHQFHQVFGQHNNIPREQNTKNFIIRTSSITQLTLIIIAGDLKCSSIHQITFIITMYYLAAILLAKIIINKTAANQPTFATFT